MLQDVLKKSLRPAQCKPLGDHSIERYRVSVKRVRQVCQKSRAGCCQKSKPRVLDALFRTRMHEIVYAMSYV